VCASCSLVQFWYFDDDLAWRGVGVQLYLGSLKDVFILSYHTNEVVCKFVVSTIFFSDCLSRRLGS
jgi:hypothetical protein